MHGREEAGAEGGKARRGLALLALADYRRLWMVGGLSNSMRWLELIATSLFVLDATGDALTVALVSAARAMPLLLFGPAAGAIAEALNRKHLLVAGLGISTLCAGLVAGLSVMGALLPWHLAAFGFATSVLAAAELSVRRRMVAESAGAATMSQAIAFDSITNAGTRTVGPIAGGAAYALAGVTGAYGISAVLNLAALLLAYRVNHVQPRRTLRLGGIAATIGEAVAIARASPIVRSVLIVTVAMNCFGFSFIALMAPIGRESFDASAIGIGLLVAAEPAGAIVGAMVLSRRAAPAGLPLFLSGATLFLALLSVMPHVPFYWLALALLLVSGAGTACFATLQSSLVLEHSPAEARSRLMGLVTMCIGTGPIGMMISGAVAAAVGAPWAVTLLALAGAAMVGYAAFRSGR
ncbi:MFS transporter [Elioraea sp.]|uniref:MFS transporter n=1 Tax=Elioraea sp. TaxID=2185103 RepID=UPI0025B8FBC8|nr:MFS transporter [Elioraea sp.]